MTAKQPTFAYLVGHSWRGGPPVSANDEMVRPDQDNLSFLSNWKRRLEK